MATKPLLSPLHFYYTPKLFEFVSSIHISALVYQLRLNLLLYQQIFTRLSKLFSFIYLVDTFLSLSLWYSIVNSKISTNTHHIWNYVAALASILTFKVSEREWRTRYTRRWTMNSERETCSMSPPTSAKCQHRDIFYRWFYLYSRRMSLVLSMKSYQFIDAINTTIPKKTASMFLLFRFFSSAVLPSFPVTVIRKQP